MRKTLKRWIAFQKMLQFCPLMLASRAFAFTIRSIQFRGLESVSELPFRQTLEMQWLNETYSPAVGRSIMTNLLESGEFETIALEQEGETLSIICVEKTRIDSFKVELTGKYGSFIENSLSLEKNLRQICQLGKNDAFSLESLEAAENHLKKNLSAIGFQRVNCKFQTIPVGKNRVKILVKGEIDDLTCLKGVQISGNKKITTHELMGRLNVRPPDALRTSIDKGIDRVCTPFIGPSFKPLALNKEIIQEELQALKAYYHSQGYLDVKFAVPKLQFTKDFSGVYIVYQVENEGIQYTIDEIKITCKGGDEVQKQKYLHRLTALAPGVSAVYNPERLQTVIQQMKSFLANEGYRRAKIEPITEIDTEKHRVSIHFNCTTGNKYYIRSIQFAGKHFMRESVLRQLLALKEGDLFTPRAWSAACERITNLKYLAIHESENSIVEVDGKFVDLRLQIVNYNDQLLGQCLPELNVGVESVVLKIGIPFTNILGSGRDCSIHLDGNLGLEKVSWRGFFQKGETSGFDGYLQATFDYTDSVTFSPNWIFGLEGSVKVGHSDKTLEERKKYLGDSHYRQYGTRYDFLNAELTRNLSKGWKLETAVGWRRSHYTFNKNVLQYWCIAHLKDENNLSSLGNWKDGLVDFPTGQVHIPSLVLKPNLNYHSKLRHSSLSQFAKRYSAWKLQLDMNLQALPVDLAKHDDTRWLKGSQGKSVQSLVSCAFTHCTPLRWFRKGRGHQEDSLPVLRWQISLAATFGLKWADKPWECIGKPDWYNTLSPSDIRGSGGIGFEIGKMGPKSLQITREKLLEKSEAVDFTVNRERPLGQTVLLNTNATFFCPAAYMPLSIVKTVRPGMFFDLKIGTNVWDLSDNELKSIWSGLGEGKVRLRDQNSTEWEIKNATELSRQLGLGRRNGLEVLFSCGFKFEIFLPKIPIPALQRFYVSVCLPIPGMAQYLQFSNPNAKTSLKLFQVGLE